MVIPDVPERQNHPPGAIGIARSLQRLSGRLVAIAAWLVAIFFFIWFFQAFKMVLLGLLAASCLASALRPVMRKLPGPRSLKGLLVGVVPPLLLAGLIVLIVWLLAAPIQRQIGQVPQMEHQINDTLAHWSNRLGLKQPVQARDVLAQLDDWLTGAGGQKIFSTTTGIASGLLIALAFVFIGSIYMLVDPPERLLEPALRLLPARRRPQIQRALEDLAPRLRWWLIGTGIGALVIGLASWLGYWLVGLGFALPLALLAGIGEIIPTVGPLVTFLVALVFAATQGLGQVIGVTIVYLVVQGLESYLLVPYVMKKAVNIPPLATLFTIVLWGKIFGPVGLLLAIPINLALWSFAEHLLVKREN